MATQLTPNTLAVSSASEVAMRRVSAPHIPLMVVVTDVDEEQPENSGKSSGEEPMRMSRGILKSDRSDSSLNGAGGASPNLSAKRVSVALEPQPKPLAKWKRICKSFIGLKGSKKNKNSSKPGQSSSSTQPDKPTSAVPAPRRSRSNSLHPGGAHVGRRLSRVSVSPSRSIQSFKSGLSATSEIDFYLCDMGNMSEILTTQDIKSLGKHFPPSAVGCSCILTFSSSVDGYSLHNLYRKMESIDSPVILAILDAEGRAFGAVLSSPLRIADLFYGTSDSFLFRCDPLEVFKWKQGANYYFIHSEENFLRIGAGKGNCGLWLDDNLFHGRTEECATFGSPPLVDEEDFEVQAVECWTFGHSC